MGKLFRRRCYKNARVFCFESGHDNQTWVDPNFREVLRHGVLWCAKKIRASDGV